jgi:hypothetical protein
MDTNKLLLLLDGPYRELRDDNHVTPNEVLVFDETTEEVEAIDLMQLPLRYPVGPGGRWSASDLGEVVKEKALLYRQSLMAYEINEEDPETEPTCGTVLLVITTGNRPYKRLEIKSRILPCA